MQELATPMKSNLIHMPPPLESRGIFDIPRCTFTPVGLVIERGMPIGDWIELGKRINKANDSLGIWRGDWINYGKREYGKKKYEEAIALTGLKEQTLKNDVWISKAIPLSARADVLTTRHYIHLAPLKSKSKIRKWIERVIKGDNGKVWTAARLNKEINKTVTKAADCETNKSYLTPEYKQFLVDYIAGQESFLSRCTYEPFKPEIERTIKRAKYQLGRTEHGDYEAVLKSIRQGASTTEEIVEDVPITEREIEVFCERAVGLPRPTRCDAPRTLGGEYEWRPIGVKIAGGKGVRPHGIFHKDSVSGDDFIDGYRPRVEYDDKEEHY